MHPNFQICEYYYLLLIVIQRITLSLKNRMITRVITFWRVYIRNVIGNVRVNNAFPY